MFNNMKEEFEQMLKEEMREQAIEDAKDREHERLLRNDDEYAFNYALDIIEHTDEVKRLYDFCVEYDIDILEVISVIRDSE